MKIAVPALASLAALTLSACGGSASPSGTRAAIEDGCVPVETAAGVLRQCLYAQDGLPQRDYYVYEPSAPAQPTALVVYLHGCNQNAVESAIQTRWNLLAEAHGFYVVYPDQRIPGDTDVEGQAFDGNGAQCWNWFREEHLHRGSGEPATLAGITQTLLGRYAIDPQRVYLMGTSAGGGMTTILGATYPDLYAALAINAGVGYPVGTDPSGAIAAQEMGEYARRMPAIVFHGTADEAAAFPLGVSLVQQWLGANDQVDDGSANNSVPRQPASTEHHGLDASLIAGAGNVGDICVGNRVASPCLGGALGFEESYPTSIEHYLDAEGKPLLDFWAIHLLTHNYVGGDPSVNFSDPLGPNITQAAYDFFLAQTALNRE